MVRPFVVVACLLMCVGAATADVEDAVIKKLNEAKAVYEVGAEKYRDSVAAHLDEREKKARDDGDKKRVDR